jgi:hypothetical protein
LYPGDITKMFNRILNDPDMQQYAPKVVSRPDYAPGHNTETADYKLGPWILLFDNAISDEEADRLIELGGIRGYQRSTGLGKKMHDGSYDNEVTASRTSANTWCQDTCYNDPLAKRVTERVENITGVPEAHHEYLQLLRYEK